MNGFNSLANPLQPFEIELEELEYMDWDNYVAEKGSPKRVPTDEELDFSKM